MNFRRFFITALVLCLLCLAGLIIFLPRLNDFKQNGSLFIPGLEKPVTVLRDEKGMAYIRAKSLDDLLMAQGFVTAQDRLFQMQLTRMLAQGRISELAGQAGVKSDMRMRTIGLYRMARKQAALLNRSTAGRFQKYVDGINAFIENCPGDIPLEFRLAGIPAEKWEISDSLSIAFYMGWATSANMNSEIIAQTILEKVGYEKAMEIMPLNFNPDDPNDDGRIFVPGKNRLYTETTGIEKLMAFTSAPGLRLGSNNWAAAGALCATKGPILCGDPHMEARFLPGPWYPVGLITPEIRAVGAGIPGLPGMVIGRTGHIALAMTNNYGDMQDLTIESIDPANPDHYLEGNISVPFDQHIETIKIKDKTAPQGYITRTFTVRATHRGPVITDGFPWLPAQKALTLRFAPAESMTTDIGLIDILTAQSSGDLVFALKKIPMICLNWVFADAAGNIGHQVSGRIPIRKNRCGAFPLPVVDASDNWDGWIPEDEMPSALNPAGNWVGTCNHKTVSTDFSHYYSSFFASSFRYRRLKELMAQKDAKTIENMWQYQRDTQNLLARAVSPILARVLSGHEKN